MLQAIVSRVLLLAFPKTFRSRLGQPLVQTLVTDCRTASGRVAVGRFLVGAGDVIRAGLAERISVRRRARPHGRHRRSRLAAWWQDIHDSARRLGRAPGFTAVAVLTLALGIGVNTALFQLLDAVRLRPLPVDSPGELVEIRIRNQEGARGNFSIWHAGATNAIWEQIRTQQTAFSGVFAWSGTGVRLVSDGGPPRFAGALLVSGDFFTVLGVRPALGRVLTDADDTRGCTRPAVVLSHAFWQREFGGDHGVVGRSLTLGRDLFQIVGVTSPEFTGLEVGRRFDVAAPLCSEWLPPGSFSRLDSGVEWFLIVMGRLKPGWTIEQAKAHLASISPAVFEASLPSNYPAENVAQYRAFELTAIDASRGISMVRDQYTTALWLLQATAALVLIVGCANLANLLLSRGTTRERELAVRLALGASRSQIVRLLVTESLLLAAAGTVAGILVAQGVNAGLVRFLDGGTDTLFLALSPDGRPLLFAAIAGALACMLAGVMPAWRSADLSPESIVRNGGRALTESRRRVGLRQALVIVQVALSLVLLFGAVLFTRSLTRLMMQDLGLDADGLMIAYVDASGAKVPVEGRAAFRQAMLRELTSTAGVLAATETSVVPLSGGSSDNEVWLDDARTARAFTYFVDIGASYFSTLRMPLIAGRTFSDEIDSRQSPRVVVVNEAFAKTFAGGANPVGRRLWREARPGMPETSYEIVGLVKDAKYQHLREAFRPTVYVAASQATPGTFVQLLIRTSLRKADVVPALRASLARVHPAIVPTFQDFRTMISRSLTHDQLLAALSGGFALLAVLLSTLGLYGSMSFAVARRTREIGVRIALGADRRMILSMVLRDACRVLVVGCIAGVVVSTWLARYAGTLLYQLEPRDPASIAGAVALLAVVGLVASLAPALRAARLDPVAACRAE